MKLFSFSIKLVCICLILFGFGCSTIQNRDDILQQAEEIRQAHAVEEVLPSVASTISVADAVVSPSIPVQTLESQTTHIKLPFENERLVYQIKFMGMIVGEMVNTFKERGMYKGRPVLIFESTAKTASFLRKFLRLKIV